MAITAAMTTSFKVDLLAGLHQPDDDYKIALFTSAATLGAATSAYAAANEVAGTGYVAGGKSLTGRTAGSSSGVAWIDFDDVNWEDANITARGALIYNATRANKAVAVLDFGADISSSGGTFSVEFPAPAAATAIIRIE